MNRSMRGFTLIEMLMVVFIFGLMVAFAIPALQRAGRTHGIKGARDDIAAQINLTRARAIASGDSIRIHFYPGSMPTYDYHTHPNTSAIPMTGFKLPKGVSFAVANLSVTMLNTGSVRTGVVIPLVNTEGVCDTITVLKSGMVVAK